MKIYDYKNTNKNNKKKTTIQCTGVRTLSIKDCNLEEMDRSELKLLRNNLEIAVQQVPVTFCFSVHFITLFQTLHVSQKKKQNVLKTDG